MHAHPSTLSITILPNHHPPNTHTYIHTAPTPTAREQAPSSTAGRTAAAPSASTSTSRSTPSSSTPSSRSVPPVPVCLPPSHPMCLAVCPLCTHTYIRSVRPFSPIPLPCVCLPPLHMHTQSPVLLQPDNFHTHTHTPLFPKNKTKQKKPTSAEGVDVSAGPGAGARGRGLRGHGHAAPARDRAGRWVCWSVCLSICAHVRALSFMLVVLCRM